MKLYHHTPKGNRCSILTYGLQASRARTISPAIYLTTKPQPATETEIWLVDVSGLTVDEDFNQPDSRAETWYQVYEDIPVSRLTLVNP